MMLKLNLVGHSLSGEQIIHLKNLAMEGHPLEVCGIVSEHDVIVQYENCSDHPGDSFDAEIDIGDSGIKAIWHSHPGGKEYPSDDDRQFIWWCENHGHHFNHIIVTCTTVNEYEAELIDENTIVA